MYFKSARVILYFIMYENTHSVIIFILSKFLIEKTARNVTIE